MTNTQPNRRKPTAPDPRNRVEGLRNLGKILREHQPEQNGLVETRDGEWRVGHLVVARESDEFNCQLLEGMILQTLYEYEDRIPGAQDLKAIGVDPVRRPDAYNARVIEEGGTRAVLFEFKGTWCLYSQGSAAKADSGSDNGFCKILTAVFAELRPRDVYIATFSRLVRNQVFAGEVMKSASDHVDTIFCREMPLDLRSEKSRFLFGVLAAFSDLERSSQMMRLALGQLASHDRSEWLHGSASVPPGYILIDRKVVPDARARHVVQALLSALAEPNSSTESVISALVELELASPTQTGGGWAYRPASGEWDPETDADLHKLLAAARDAELHLGRYHDPRGLVGKWRKDVGLWATGTLERKLEVPSRLDRIGQHAVHLLPGHGRRGKDRDSIFPYVILKHDLGLPEGGWVPDVLFEAIADVHQANRFQRRNNAGNDVILPLLALAAEWECGERLWALSHGRGNSHHYSLISIDRQSLISEKAAAASGRATGWYRNGTFLGTVEGKMHAADLHHAIAVETASALERGIHAQILAPRDSWPALKQQSQPTQGPVASSNERDLNKAYRAARLAHESYEGDDQAHEDMLRARSDDALRNYKAARRERLSAPSASSSEATITFIEHPSDLLLAALAELGTTIGPVPIDHADKIAQVLQNFRGSVSADGFWIDWSIEAHVPGEVGTLVLGPITGRLRNRVSGTTRKSTDAIQPERDDVILDALLQRGIPMRDLQDANATHGANMRLRLRERLESRYGLTRRTSTSVLTCVVPETRAALWALIRGEPVETVTPEFADHLRQVYLVDGVKARGWWTPNPTQNNIRPVLLAQGGSITSCRSRDAFQAAGIPDHWPGHNCAPVSKTPYLLRTDRPNAARPSDCTTPRCAHSTWSFLPCPHCPGAASLSVRVPEVESQVICPDCMRSPDPNSPRYPDAYRDLNDQHVQERLLDVCPDIIHKSDIRTARRNNEPVKKRDLGTKDLEVARQWAAEQGLRPEQWSTLPRWLVIRWLDAVKREPARAVRAVLPDSGKPADIRSWARAKGLKVSARGRLPKDVLDAYTDARLAEGAIAS